MVEKSIRRDAASLGLRPDVVKLLGSAMQNGIFDTLTPTQRFLICKYASSGMSYRQIAMIYDMHPKTVARRVTQGIRVLQQNMPDEYRAQNEEVSPVDLRIKRIAFVRQETKDKISKTKKGMVFSEEHKRKLSEAAKNRRSKN